MRLNKIYAAVLNNQEYEMPRNAKGLEIDVKRLNRLFVQAYKKAPYKTRNWQHRLFLC